jgi:hypothetical protein
LTKCGAALPNFGPLEDLVQANAEIANRFGTLVQ